VKTTIITESTRWRRVGRDVNLGYVTKAAARDSYGVVIGENGAVDTAATAALRSGAGQ
jgi:hypothetical protein